MKTNSLSLTLLFALGASAAGCASDPADDDGGGGGGGGGGDGAGGVVPGAPAMVTVDDGADRVLPHFAVTKARYEVSATSPKTVRGLDGSTEYSNEPPHTELVNQTL